MRMPRRRSYAPTSLRAARTQLIIGTVLLVAGILITAVTYSNASSSPTGGTYFVMWGPLIFGFIRGVTALPVLVRARRAVAQGQGAQPAYQVGTAPHTAPAWGGQAGLVPQGPAGWGSQAGPAPQVAPGWADQAVVSGPGGGGPAAGGPVPGWYPDPSGRSGSRWWDGAAWTEHTL
jgi:hypothetical protein